VEFADNRHATDEALERYSMDRLAGPELAEFEEHLLLCRVCQDRLAVEDNVKQRVRDGAELLLRPSTAVQWRLPVLAWSSGLVAVGLLVFAGSQLPSLHRPTAQPAVMLLQTTRGTENLTLAAAPAGRPLTLVLDLTDLQQFSAYTLEIVDAGSNRAVPPKIIECKARSPMAWRPAFILSGRTLPRVNYSVNTRSPCAADGRAEITEIARHPVFVTRGGCCRPLRACNKC
jgi:hypothetical protein